MSRFFWTYAHAATLNNDRVRGSLILPAAAVIDRVIYYSATTTSGTDDWDIQIRNESDSGAVLAEWSTQDDGHLSSLVAVELVIATPNVGAGDELAFHWVEVVASTSLEAGAITLEGHFV